MGVTSSSSPPSNLIDIETSSLYQSARTTSGTLFLTENLLEHKALSLVIVLWWFPLLLLSKSEYVTYFLLTLTG